MDVYAVLSDDDSGELEMEFFDRRPNTPGMGGDDGNWPKEYEVRVGSLNGGDSIVVEKGYAHQVRVYIVTEGRWVVMTRDYQKEGR